MGTTLGERLEAAVAKSGKTREQVEQQARLGKGYLSKLINDPSRKLGYDKARDIAAVTGVAHEWLLTGVEVPTSQIGQVPNVPPPLERIEGYQDAEIEVARREPKIPVDVFRRARATRFDPPPDSVTPEFLRGLVVFLAASRKNVDKAVREMETTVRARRGA
jgi:transcriptional regulator with XRE-family HTH domain